MQPSDLPPKKRTVQHAQPAPTPPPSGVPETSKIRGTAPPRSPSIGPAFQAALPALRPLPAHPPPSEEVGEVDVQPRE